MVKYGGPTYQRREVYNCRNKKAKSFKVKEVNAKYLEEYVLLQLDKLLVVPNAKERLTALIISIINENKKSIAKP